MVSQEVITSRKFMLSQQRLSQNMFKVNFKKVGICSVKWKIQVQIIVSTQLLSSFSSLQGSVFSSWKPMWVVLLEDGIEFYNKKSDNSPKGMIPLKGSTLTSPCQDFGKRMVSANP